jgi:hypothetical protein
LFDKEGITRIPEIVWELTALNIYHFYYMLVVLKVKHAGVNIYMDILSPFNLKDICNTIMNMDPRVRFVGVLAKDAKLIEGGMRKEVSPLLPADKDDLFYLRIISHLKELKDLASTLGDLGYVFIKMAKISFVYLSLKDSRTLLVSMEPDVDPSFIIPTIRNYMVE